MKRPANIDIWDPPLPPKRDVSEEERKIILARIEESKKRMREKAERNRIKPGL